MEQPGHARHDADGIIENREQKPPAYFTVLFYGLIVWGIAFSAFYLLSGWSSDAEFQHKMAAHENAYQKTTSPPAAPEPPVAKPEAAQLAAAAAPVAAAADGKALYAQRCAMCHGAEAKGGIGPDLTEDEYVYGRTPEAVTVSIAEGRPKGMPAFSSQLKPEEIKALVDYLLSL